MNTSVQFTDEQKENGAKLLRKAAAEKGFSTQASFANYSGVTEVTVGKIFRKIADGNTFATVVLPCLYLDIDIYEMIHTLGLDEGVKERMKDPETAHLYHNLKWMLEDGDKREKQSPLDALVSDLPQEKRDIAKSLIQSTLDTMRKS